ncbi:MAG: formylglycine-generating enzyme family protein [Candidatus Coatesbacteria bacterium]|nr:formylglycine-generating enzyme family protein [Candidatus Coatesbacteria bacterium]
MKSALLITLMSMACLAVCAVSEPIINIHTDFDTYQAGDTIEVGLSADNQESAMSVDVYVGVLLPNGDIYSVQYDGWSHAIEPWIPDIFVPAWFTLDPTVLWTLDIPSSLPPIGEPGDYNFAAVLTYPGTFYWACGLGLAPFSVISSGPTVEVDMIAIPAGSFEMGSPTSEEERDPDEGPIRTVKISAFEMSDTEITEGQWEAVMGWNDCYNKFGDDYPVENVTWFDCVSFCNKLSRANGYSSCYTISNEAFDGDHMISAEVACDFGANGYRLPTEAEWEYACRAGTGTRYFTGDAESDLSIAGWYHGNSAPSMGEPRQKRLVGQKLANDFGLHDTHGNVWEWCWDRYASDYYSTQPDPDTDPLGPSTGTHRLLRGGCWNTLAIYCRAAFRNWDEPNTLYSSLGLRVVRVPN